MNRPAVDCDALSRIVADHLRFGGECDAKTPAIACGYLAATRSIAGRILDELVAADPTFDRRTFERETGLDFGLDEVDPGERCHFAARARALASSTIADRIVGIYDRPVDDRG